MFIWYFAFFVYFYEDTKVRSGQMFRVYFGHELFSPETRLPSPKNWAYRAGRVLVGFLIMGNVDMTPANCSAASFTPPHKNFHMFAHFLVLATHSKAAPKPFLQISEVTCPIL